MRDVMFHGVRFGAERGSSPTAAVSRCLALEITSEISVNASNRSGGRCRRKLCGAQCIVRIRCQLRSDGDDAKADVVSPPLRLIALPQGRT